MKIIYNNKIYNDSELQLALTCNGFNYGEGFFTTIRVEKQITKNFNFHKKRIIDSLSFFNFLDDKSLLIVENLEKKIDELVALNNLSNARIKIIFFRDIELISYVIFCNRLIISNEKDYTEEHNLTISKSIRGNDNIFKYKSLNYYSNLINKNCILVDHKNRILETGFANIFLIFNNVAYTPPKHLPILPGTVREYLLSLEKIGIYKFMEKELFVEDIKNCEGVFITNSIIEIGVVSKIDNFLIPTNITKNLKKSVKL